jgi:hypothetical protein
VISNNEQMRNEIVNGQTTLTNQFIEKSIPKIWGFSTCVTDIDKVCNNAQKNDKNVYVSETIISSSLTSYTISKKLRFFVWEK